MKLLHPIRALHVRRTVRAWKQIEAAGYRGAAALLVLAEVAARGKGI